jgi:hypothetical protein
MVSLLSLLKEVQSSPKAIVLGGSAASGKSYIVNNILGNLKDNIFSPSGSDMKFKYLNPDIFVEKQNLSLGKAMSKFNQEFSQTQDKKENILWDTTAANIKNTLNKLDGYDKFMIMVYTHPIISILQNTKRDRTLPLKAVVKTWNRVYSNIEEYKNQLGDNFLLFPNNIPGYEKEIKQFNQAVKGGDEKLEQYLNDLVQQNPEEFKSSFSKPFEFDNKEIEQAFEEELSKTSFDEKKDEDILKNIKKEFQKEYLKNNSNPDSKILEKKLNLARKTFQKNQLNYKDDIKGIINKLTSSEFREIIDPISSSKLKSKLKTFLNK